MKKNKLLVTVLVGSLVVGNMSPVLANKAPKNLVSAEIASSINTNDKNIDIKSLEKEGYKVVVQDGKLILEKMV
ncbi:hypothetical protein ABID14_002009 [Peptoniphilus olsenii]|uniref:Uncharacterized protein n=1 Tax=Peptoniphilus olsenii TaxID=411570 RepID=A0ABV2JC34_9FIRM